MDIDKLNIMCWNCRGVYSAIPYLSEFLSENEINICGLSEHWLRSYQLHALDTINKDYYSIPKGVDFYNPDAYECNTRSGVAFLVSRNLSSYVTTIDIDSDRIIGIELNIPNGRSYLILSVYLPATTQPFHLFRENIEMLHELISTYHESKSVLVIGDFNTKICGPRYDARQDDRGELMNTLLDDFSLYSVNMDNGCTGPIMTFQSYSTGPSTGIDHILLPEHCRQDVLAAKVVNDSDHSTSDHRPILCSLTLPGALQNSMHTNKTVVSWERAKQHGHIHDYSYAVSQNLWTLEFPNCDISQKAIDTYYSDIVCAIKKADHDTLPHSKFKAYLKPYWNENLNTLRNNMRLNRTLWINNCHCYEMSCEYFKNYKDSKRLYRVEMRKAFDNYQSSITRKFESDIDADQKSVWNILNRRKSKHQQCSALRKNGVLFTDRDDILDVWHEHFQKVFSTSEYSDPNRGNYLKDRVNMIREQCFRERSLDDISFQHEDMLKICDSLKHNKACGHDAIAYEHIRYGGKLLRKHLEKLFEIILHCGCIPSDWRKSIIILLHKGGNKSKTDTNSYRGISLVPCIAKIFEKLVELELSRIRPNFPNPQQVAYQKGLSSLNASFNLQETTYHHVERNGTMNVVLLDSSKAFDTVSHDGLRLKLWDYGATPKLWILLDNMYTGLSSAIFSGGQLSNWFNLNRGVRQGSVLSAKLYLIFINDLINQIENSNSGAKVYDLNSSSPVQADDISLASTNFRSLQDMVNICEQYSKDWSFTFSATKSHLLQFGQKTTGQNILLYGEPITQVPSAKHVGITIRADLRSTDRTSDVCRTLRSSVSSFIRLGVHPAILNPGVCAKLITQVCYPRATYGCELWGKISSSETMSLERTHRHICKFIQGLPRSTRTDMCLSLLGWFRLEAYIIEKKLLFLGRICNLPSSAVSFRILIRRLYDFKYNNSNHPSIGFVCDICDILRKYGLDDHLENFLENATFPSKQQWKRIVKQTIRTSEIEDWNSRILNDEDFRAFREIHKSYELHPAWKLMLKYPYLRRQARYLVSTCCLIRENDENYSLCHRCGKTFYDPMIHAISACDYLDEIRDSFWCEIIDIDPIDFSVFLASLGDRELCYCLLSCRSSDFELEQGQEEIFQQICVRYIYRFGTTFV